MFLIESAELGIMHADDISHLKRIIFNITKDNRVTLEVDSWATQCEFGHNFVNQMYKFTIQCIFDREHIKPIKNNKNYNLTSDEIFIDDKGHKWIYLGHGKLKFNVGLIDNKSTYNYINYSYIEENNIPFNLDSAGLQAISFLNIVELDISKIISSVVRKRKVVRVVEHTHLSDIRLIRINGIVITIDKE